MYWRMDSLAWVGLTLVLGAVMAVRFVQQRIRRRTEHERARIRDRLRSKDCWVSVGMLSGGRDIAPQLMAAVGQPWRGGCTP